MAVRLACRGGSGNIGLLAHILVVQEAQPGCKCQGSPLRDPFPPGRLHFLKVSVSQTQPSSRHHVFKHLSFRETVHIHTAGLEASAFSYHCMFDSGC